MSIGNTLHAIRQTLDLPDLDLNLLADYQEEVKPPCQTVLGALRGRCPNAAEWIIAWKCEAPHVQHTLHCLSCKDGWMERQKSGYICAVGEPDRCGTLVHIISVQGIGS